MAKAIFIVKGSKSIWKMKDSHFHYDFGEFENKEDALSARAEAKSLGFIRTFVKKRFA